MNVRRLTLACLGVAALAAPASAQIIATSIPREGSGGTGSASDRKFALHLMASPFAKWKINSLEEDPPNTDFPDILRASTTDSSSKFILAGEAAFAASDDVTVGVGGWYNTLGDTDVEVLELDFVEGLVFFGPTIQNISASEVHANVFYRSVGLQVGLVRTKAKNIGFRAGSQLEFLDTGEAFQFTRDVTFAEVGIPETTVSTNNLDAFLVYKRGASADSSLRWSLSAGAGIFRYTQAKKTAFSGFATASVPIFKGLGIDASFWYVGSTKKTATQAEFAAALEDALADNLSRFTIGVGYTFN
jgi:hypothetical protein